MKQYIILIILLSVSVFMRESASGTDLNEISVLDIETAQKITLAENPSLEAARERIFQARERVFQAGSRYWPRLDATGSGSRVWLADNAYPVPGTDDPEDYYRAGLTATYVLFDGFEREFSLSSARFAEDETRESRMNIGRLLLSGVAQSYYNACLARENVTIAEANETFYQRQVRDARVRREVGAGSLSDVLSFQIQVNSARTELLGARQTYRAAIIGLATLMGIPEAKLPAHISLAPLNPETREDLSLPQSDPLITYALAHRPDMLQSDYALKRSRTDTGVVKAGLYPTVTIAGSVEGERAGSLDLDKGDFGHSIALSLSYNIFDAGATQSRVREAKLKESEAESNKQDVRLTVVSDVRSALSALKSAQNQVPLQRTNAELVAQNRDLVEKEYKAGEVSLVRLNEAQRDLIAARGRLASALAALRQAWHELDVSTGKALTRFEEYFDQP